MSQAKGKLIVLEGAGGAGKTTQAKLLAERFRQENYSVFEISFPRYTTEPYGPLIKSYLSGEFGDSNKVDVRLASMLFAGDRLGARDELNQHLAKGEIIVATRYTASNMAYQLAKIYEKSELEKTEFLDWLLKLEYEHNLIPKEDLLVLQYLSAETTLQMIDGRKDEGRDGHEPDSAHMAKIIDCYRMLVAKFPHWHEVDCSSKLGSKNALRSEADIHNEIWALVQNTLA